MISAVATALGAATVAITLLSGGFTAAESASASGTLIDAQIVEVYVFLLAAFTGFQIITKVPPLAHAADGGNKRHLRDQLGGEPCHCRC